MKKYLVALVLCFFLIPNVTHISAATSIPTIKITSNLEPGDTEVEVAVTNYNDEMDGYLAIEVGEDTDESNIDESTYFTVPELEKGNQIEFYYVDANEKRTLLKSVTVTNPILPKLAFTNKLTEQSESINYKITNYDARFEEGLILVKVQEDVYEEYIVENTGSIALSESFKAGTPFKLYYVNKNDREFYVTTVNVQANTPSKLTVPSVTNRTKTFKVTYGENGTVTLKSGKKTYKGKELANGQYQLTIPSQKIGTKLTITAIDHAGKKQTKTITVTKKSGTTIQAKSITTKSTKVTGTTKNTIKGDKVEVIIGKKTYKTTITKSNGSYSVKIPKQKAGTLVKNRVVDSGGNILYTISKRVSK